MAWHFCFWDQSSLSWVMKNRDTSQRDCRRLESFKENICKWLKKLNYLSVCESEFQSQGDRTGAGEGGI